MRRVLLGIILCSAIICFSRQTVVCSDDFEAMEQRFIKKLLLPFTELIEKGEALDKYGNYFLNLECRKVIKGTEKIINQWNRDFPARFFIPTIQRLREIKFSEATHAKLAETLGQIISECSYQTMLNSAHGYDKSNAIRSSYNRDVLLLLLKCSQANFLAASQRFIDVITFLEEATAGVYNASRQYMLKIINYPMSECYDSSGFNVVESSAQDEQVAHQFFTTKFSGFCS
jgi:hypothetical protein